MKERVLMMSMTCLAMHLRPLLFLAELASTPFMRSMSEGSAARIRAERPSSSAAVPVPNSLSERFCFSSVWRKESARILVVDPNEGNLQRDC